MLDHRTFDLTAAVSRYAVSYVEKVCAQAHIGFTETAPGGDVLAIDGTIEYDITGVRVQIKGSTQPSLTPQDGVLSFRIEESWRTKWRRNGIPTFFIYVLVEREISDWLTYQPCSTLAGAYALWGRIDDIDPDATHIYLNRADRFTYATVGDWYADLVAQFGGLSA